MTDNWRGIYELETNRPLYMFRRGQSLHIDIRRLGPSGALWLEDRIARLDESGSNAIGHFMPERPALRVNRKPPSEDEVRRIIASLDDQGRWLKTFNGERLVGQGKFQIGEEYLSSELFSERLTALSRFLAADQASP